MKKIFLLLLSCSLLLWVGLAQDYILFYGNWCTHCAKVEKFLKEHDVYDKFYIQEKEIYFNGTNRNEFLAYGEKLGISPEDMGIPLLIVNNENTCTNLIWDKKIIDYFTEKLTEEISPATCTSSEFITGVIKLYNHESMPKQKTTDPIIMKQIEDEGAQTVSFTWNVQIIYTGDEQVMSENTMVSWQDIQSGTIVTATTEIPTLKDRLWFFAIMLPAAISDSINPCEFAVIILLLWTILIRTQSRKRVIMTWLAFSLAIFISYFLLWIGLWKIFASTANTNVVKIIAGSLGILVWLANLKDVFRYGKWFVMEVPFSRRTKLKALIQDITSPIGAFCIGIVVSLFLLPCTSWPYITILSYLSAEQIDKFWWIIYLLVYNVFFIVPMVVITFLVSLWKAKTEHLSNMKDKYNRHIHLIVWLLMLGLGLYCLLTM